MTSGNLKSFFLGILLGGLVAGVVVSLWKKTSPSEEDMNKPPVPVHKSLCSRPLKPQEIFVNLNMPYVRPETQTMCAGESVTWKPGSRAVHFKVQFAGGEKPFKDSHAQNSGNFDENNPTGTANDPDPTNTNPDKCYKYFKYSIQVNKGPVQDPGVIIER